MLHDSTAPSTPLTLATIVATVGPASSEPAMLSRLIQAGVSVFRLNFSHGKLEQHAVVLTAIRQQARELQLPIGVLGDLPGPKIRLGDLPEPIELAAGQTVILDAGETAPTTDSDGNLVLPCGYHRIGEDVLAGHRVLINDGLVRLLAVDHQQRAGRQVLRCCVTPSGGGPVSSRKGINLPDSDLSVQAMAERDWQAVAFAVENGLDYLALSFVRTADEVLRLQEHLRAVCTARPSSAAASGPASALPLIEPASSAIPVIAKIEKPQAVKNLTEITRAADGIMVARGDLGVEMDIADVPIVQRKIIQMADEWGKPCIVATQMLESMITSSMPTRAEATDVAGAVLAGADALMLSGETAVGKHPVLVVETMRRIIARAEQSLSETRTQPSPPKGVIQTGYRTAALAHGAWYVARDVGAKLIICWSEAGGAARYLSQTGFGIPIIAYSSSRRDLRRMALLKGVRPMRCEVPPAPAGQNGAEGLTLADWNVRVDQDITSRGWAKPGDTVILLAGRPLGVPKTGTVLAIHTVGQAGSGFLAWR